MFSKKWIALSLTAAMLAANLTMPMTSLSVMGADITQEEASDSAAFEEDSAAVESEESSAEESIKDDNSDDQEASTDYSEPVDQGSEAFENSDMSEKENENYHETDETEETEETAEPEEEFSNAPAEEDLTEDPAAGQDQADTDPGQQVQAGPEEQVTAEEAANSAQTKADTAEEFQVLTAEPMTEIIIPAEDCCPDTDNNDVFAGYVNRELKLDDDLQFDTGEVDDVADRMEKAFASTRLTGYNRTIYAILLREIKKVAAGERSDTEFTVTLEDLGLADKYWTAEDLGVDPFMIYELSDEAIEKLNEKVNINFLEINRSLLADCPYDLYWYDKTTGTPSSGFGYQTDYINGECVLKFSDTYDYTFSFPVEAEYSVTGQENTYKFNTNIGNAVQTAYDTAQSIVDQNASKSDFEKMKTYKEKICDLVDYNDDAAAGSFSWGYGNPWQLIWVFDNDASTKVVCEGYSKSFQYLCDLSSWNDIFKECISVSGAMDGGTGAGGHMWNIVTLRNGKNYLVDVTNCDDGTIGDGNGRSDLFLVGTGTDSGSTVYAQGNIDDGYYFPGLNNLIYAYNSDARTRFGDAVLTLSAGKVTANTTADGSYTGDHTHIYAPVHEVEATCTEEGHSAYGQCSICGEYDDNYEIYPAKGHTPGDWTVSLEPTYDKNGQETATCTVCGSELTRPVDKLVSETGITLDETEAIIETGNTKQLTATVLPENAHDKTVTWTSSNTSVAKVSSTGLVSAVASGSAVITAKTSHLGLTATCNVIVNDPVLIDINDATVSEIRSQTYTGEPIAPTPVVKMDSVTLNFGTDYDLSYGSNTNAGQGLVKIIGKGQYTNVKTVTFTINKAFISNTNVTGITEKTYNGSEQTQNLVVKYKSKTLTKNTDYLLSYENNTNVGTARIIITGRGNFTGTALKTFPIIARSIENADIDEIPAQTYTGNELKPAVNVTVDGNTLTSGTDYTVSYSNNINVGTATVTVTGIGNYTGTAAEKQFTISPKSIADAVVEDIPAQTYTGNGLEPAVTVTLDGKTLKSGTDYTVSYSSNTAAGTATVTVTGKGNYTGTAPKKQFTINKKSISGAVISDIPAQTYTGNELKPAVTVTLDGKTLTSETDYTVSYSSNTAAGTATVTVTGKGNYTGTAPKKQFTINKKSISGAVISDIPAQTYTGNELKPAVTVTLDGKVLTPGTDYTVAYNNNINPGKATVTITGSGNYSGTVTTEFSITDKKSIEDAEITGIVDKIFNGSEQTQTPVVKYDGQTLVKDKDYEVSYRDNTDVGTATVIITGKGNYTGTKEAAFTIKPVGWYEEDGERYYYKEDGSKLINGWASDEKGWYWLDADGKITKSKWVKSADKWYYMNSNGIMTTGWQQIGGKWYYMNSNGAMTTGWQQIGGKWYYMNSSGIMTTGWQQIGGKWYYMNSSGVMTTGWQKIGGKWYYMNSNGIMTTGWQQIGGKWYYMNSSGIMTTGWQKIGGKWYYMNSNGIMMTGWQKIGGKWYYMNSSGVLVK